MGEGALIWVVSTEEMHSDHISVMTNVHGLRANMDSVTGIICELINVVLQSCDHLTVTPGCNMDIVGPQQPALLTTGYQHPVVPALLEKSTQRPWHPSQFPLHPTQRIDQQEVNLPNSHQSQALEIR